MNEDQNIEERLWSYIDGNISREEKTVIDRLIENDAAWKTRHRELMQLNEWLRSSELDAPSMRFTRNVMEEISKLHIAPATKSYINKRLIWGLGIFFITMFIGFLVYGFAQVDWNTGQSSSIAEKFNQVDIGKFFNNTWMNALMMINVILGLFLLDNYLTNKKKQFRRTARHQ